MSEESLPHSEIILSQTEDGRMRIQCRLEKETVWLAQLLSGEVSVAPRQSRVEVAR